MVAPKVEEADYEEEEGHQEHTRVVDCAAAELRGVLVGYGDGEGEGEGRT
jgi:hypothetical protein